MHRKMKQYCIYVTGLMVWPAVLARAAPVSLPAAYQILLHKSIFSRNRITYSRRRRPGHAAPTPRPEAPVFIGAIHKKGKMIALLESPRSGSIRSVQAHSVVPGPYGGLIVQITLQSLKIVRRGKPPAVVSLGENLLGTSAVLSSAPSTAAPAAAGSSGPPVSPAQESIIEMLRRQRQQENK